MTIKITQQEVLDRLGDVITLDKISGLHINDNNEILFSIVVSPEEGAPWRQCAKMLSARL